MINVTSPGGGVESLVFKLEIAAAKKSKVRHGEVLCFPQNALCHENMPLFKQTPINRLTQFLQFQW